MFVSSVSIGWVRRGLGVFSLSAALLTGSELGAEAEKKAVNYRRIHHYVFVPESAENGEGAPESVEAPSPEHRLWARKVPMRTRRLAADRMGLEGSVEPREYSHDIHPRYRAFTYNNPPFYGRGGLRADADGVFRSQGKVRAGESFFYY